MRWVRPCLHLFGQCKPPGLHRLAPVSWQIHAILRLVDALLTPAYTGHDVEVNTLQCSVAWPFGRTLQGVPPRPAD